MANPYPFDPSFDSDYVKYELEQLRKMRAATEARWRKEDPKWAAEHDAMLAQQEQDRAATATARGQKRYEAAVAKHEPVGLGGLLARGAATPIVLLDVLGSKLRGEEPKSLPWYLNEPPQPSEYGEGVVGVPREERSKGAADDYLGGLAKGGIAALKNKADQLESASRYPDTTLVHMAPDEIMMLRKIALEKYGTDLPRNPRTGLYEAGILSSLFGMGVGFLTANPYLGAAAAGAISKGSGHSWTEAALDAFSAYGGGAGLNEAAAQGAAAEGIAGAQGATRAGMEAAAKVAGAPGAGVVAGMPAGASADIGLGATNTFETMANPNATRMLDAQYTQWNPPTSDMRIAQDIGSTDMGRVLRTDYGMPPSAPTTPMPPAVAPASPTAYADLGWKDRLGYAGQRVWDKPWDFVSKDVGATPATMLAGQGIQALQEKPVAPAKRNPRFYSYNYDPATGTFSGETESDTPSWMASGGMANGNKGLGDLNDAHAKLAEMEAAMAPGYSRGGRMVKGRGDGTSDQIPAVIDARQPAALSDGEFVIPARVVSELGNGSSDAGARKLQAMMARVEALGRKAKRGSDTKAERYLPA